MTTYEIRLSNGVTLQNLTLNGNNYVSDTPVSKEMFVNGLDTVTITGSDGSEEVLHDATLVQIAEYPNDYPGKYFIVILELPKSTGYEQDPEAADKAAAFDILMGGE